MPRKRGPPHPADRRLAGDGGPADAADARRGSDLVLGADRPRSAGRLIQTDPFTRTGFITIVDASGHEIFGSAPTDLTERAIVAEAIGLLAAGTRLISVEPYRRPDGEVMLGAFAFPRPFEWAVLVEKRQRDAYLAIETMLQSLGLWVIVGLAVAVAGAIALALRISRPTLKIDRVANEVAKGNFQARVEGVRTRDEIGDLARRMNDMVVGLNERFQLAKFVSSGTLTAIKSADQEGVRLGGERRLVTMMFCDIRGYTGFAERHDPGRLVTMMFCDIRGYTGFAERHDPEVVVEVLNLYFQNLSELVVSHGGDIDKYVGDQIVAVFQGEEMAANAVRCALAMQHKMAALAGEHPDWHLAIGIGINTGDVILGAMGSRERMDYTVLGDHVNLAARLCAQADPGQILITASFAAGDCRRVGIRHHRSRADQAQGQERAGAGLRGRRARERSCARSTSRRDG